MMLYFKVNKLVLCIAMLFFTFVLMYLYDAVLQGKQTCTVYGNFIFTLVLMYLYEAVLQSKQTCTVFCNVNFHLCLNVSI